MTIGKEGPFRKFVEQVQHITFSGRYGAMTGRRILEFFIEPDLIDAYSEMQKYLTENYFTRVSRYTTSAFLRMKLGGALEKRGLPPHIYESADEAHAFWHPDSSRAIRF